MRKKRQVKGGVSLAKALKGEKMRDEEKEFEEKGDLLREVVELP